MNVTDASLSTAELIDAACDRFEAEWKAGRKPKVEDFLVQENESVREAVRQAIVAVRDELMKSGETSITRSSVRVNANERTRTAVGVAETDPTTIGRFTIRGVLGQGAFGKVYLGFDDQLGREVAIKFPVVTNVSSDSERAKFLKEARAAATINHPNVCQIYEVGEDAGRPYIVMALVPGQALSDTIKSLKTPLTEKQIAIIIRKAALALAAAHDKGIIHRDLKTANIMFDRERKDIVVMDFGLARGPMIADERATQSGVIMGTPAYMSPEQARGDARNAGPSSDVYSLGVILYELLTNRRPFLGTATEVIGKILHVEPEAPGTIKAGIDPRLDAICLKAMAKDMTKRYANMKELVVAIDVVLRNPKPVGPSAETARAEETRDDTSISKDKANLSEVFAVISMERKVARAETAEVINAAIAKHKTPRWIFIAIGVLLFGVLGAAGIIFFTKSDKVKVTIELTEIDLKDKTLSFFLDEEPISAEALAKPMELKPGDHWLVVKRGKDVVKRLQLIVTGGKQPGIRMKDHTPEQEVKPAYDGFVPLFNGKDFTGWQADDGSPVTRGWVVRDKSIVRAKSTIPSPDIRETMRETIWTTQRFGDYELQLEFQTDGNSGIHIRTDDPKDFRQTCIEVQINLPSDKLDNNSVGAFYGLQAPSKQNVRANDWNTARITARGSKLSVVINGEMVNEMNLDDWTEVGKNPDQSPNTYKAAIKSLRRDGHIGLQAHNGQISFRNIRIKELNDGFVPLFNGKDLTGWKNHPDEPGDWKVENGILVGRGPKRNDLYTERGDYKDFHFFVEARVNRGNGGQIFRAPEIKTGTPLGYEAIIDSIGSFNRNKTGSFYILDGDVNSTDFNGSYIREDLVPQDTWFTQEVIAQGNHIIIKVNGKVVTEFLDKKYSKGHLALRLWRADTVLEFRQIKVKELKEGVKVDPDREAALWIQRIGGQGQIRVEGDAVDTDFDKNSALPTNPFRLVNVYLYIFGPVTEEDTMRYLKPLRHVRQLDLEVDANPKLSTLDFLEGWSELRILRTGGGFKGSIFDRITSSCPDIEELQLSGYARQTFLLEKFAGLKKLKNLNFFYSHFHDDDFTALGKFPALKNIHFGKSKETDEQIAGLKKANPDIGISRDP